MYILAQDQNGLVRSKTQGLCFSLLGGLPSYCPIAARCLLAIRCLLIMDAAQVEAEAVKVETWCRQNGLQSSSDLAFYFVSYEEALSEAGRAVARSWQVARQSSEQGVAGLVRGLFAAEKKGQEMPKPSISPRLKPVVAKPSVAVAPVPGKKRGYVHTDEKPLVSDENAMQQFMDMLLKIGQHRADDARARTNFKAIIREALTKSEPATVKRGLQTWQELQRAMVHSAVVELDAHFLAQFAREASAPSRVFHALKWLGRNFPVSMDLALLVAPTKQAGGRYGGGRQAPVVPPPIIHYLDDLLATAVDSKQWSAILAAWMMVFGVVRFGHLQRSNLAFWNESVMVFFCQKGKQMGTREGFFWSIPRWSMSGHDLLATWCVQEKAMRAHMVAAKLSFHHCAFDLAEGRPLSMQGFLGAVREHLQPLIKNIGDLTSYSFRRVAPTVSALADRSEPEKVALGGWTDQASSLSVTAARYNAQKGRQSAQLKIAMLFVLRQLRAVDSWHSVSLSMCAREWEAGMKVADDAIAAAGPWISSDYHIPNMPVIKELSLEQAQVVRLRARTMLKRSLKAGVSPPDAVLAEGSPRVRLPVAGGLPAGGQGVSPSKAKAVPLPVKAKPMVPRVSPEEARAESLEDDEFFNRAANRWNQRGHSGNPEPPTLIWRASNGRGSVWLGGLPSGDDTRFMEENNITLLVSAMNKTAAEAGGYRGSRALQLAVPVSYHGRDRQDAWLHLRQVLVATLGVGQSAWFHCMAGVHRGPILCAAGVAFVQRLEFWKVYSNIERLRNVDRAGVLSRRGGADTFSWAEGVATAPTEPVKLHLPVQWVASSRRGTAWHVASVRRVDDRLQPYCKWRQSTSQSVFKGEVITAESAAEALLADREFCKTCLAAAPAGDQALILN